MTLEALLLCVIPLLVAVDAIGVLPLYLGMTEGLPRAALNRILWQSMATASVVALLFLYGGEALFRVLDITSADFMIAGGILLLAISLSDMLTGQKRQRQIEPDTLGAVPLGVPLIVGPAVLTTMILLSHRFGPFLTALAALLNIILAGLVFRASGFFNRILGKSGMRACSKIASLVLAAIAVRMMREGLEAFQYR